MPPMFDLVVDDADFKRFLEEKIRNMPEIYGEALGTGLLWLQGEIPPYPPQSRKPFRFVSERQRRYVMASIRNGEIVVPYRRAGSGGIGGSITTEVRRLGADTVGVIGTNKIHAPYVIDEEKQAEYHKGNWWTLQAVVRDKFDRFMEVFASDFVRRLLR